MKLTSSIVHMSILITASLFLLLTSTYPLYSRDIPEDTVLAEFDGGTITVAQLEEEILNIPEIYRSRFRTVQGKQNFLSDFAVRTLLLKKAKSLDIHLRDDVLKRISEALKPYIVEEFVNREINNKVVLTTEEKRKFYEDNISLYTHSPNIAINYIQVDNAETAEKVAEKFAEGVPFIDILNSYSTHTYSISRSGRIENIRNNGYIPGVGRLHELDEIIYSSEIDNLVGPLEIDSKFHFFKKIRHVPGSVSEFSEVSENIERRLRPRLQNEKRDQMAASLKKSYGISLNEELLSVADFGTTLPAELREELIATSTYDDLTLTAQDFMTSLSSADPQQRAQMQNPDFLRKAVEDFIRQELFYLEAVKRGIDRTITEVSLDAKRHSQHIILTTLTDELIVSQSDPTESDILDYYEENIELYRSRAHRTAQLFVFENRRQASRQHRNVKRALSANDEERIEQIVEEHSQLQRNNGFITHIYEQGVIQGFGRDEKILQNVWGTPLNQLSDVFEDEKGQWIFLRVTENYDSILNPIDNVRGQIVNNLRRSNIQENWKTFEAALKDDYNLVLYPERIKIQLTSQELFTLAEEAQKRRRFDEAIMYYNQIIESYQNNEDDYKALFMKAFIYAEELNQQDEAKELFEELLSEYPHSELHESAAFMIQTIESGGQFHIDFE